MLTNTGPSTRVPKSWTIVQVEDRRPASLGRGGLHFTRTRALAQGMYLDQD